jgi:hypothetical protein
MATTDDEVDLTVSILECTIGVAPFGWWWWSPFLAIIVMAIVVVLATSIITSIILSVVALVVAAITLVVATSVVMVIAMVVVAPIITVVVAAIITLIPVLVATIGPAITVISPIRSTVTVVEALAIVPVVIVAATGLLRGRRDPKGMLQLLALSHGVLGVTVELALVVHDHVEVAFEEGGGSWWICHVGFARSFAQPGAFVIVVFSVKVVHHCVLSVDQFVDAGHEVTNGMCVSFMDLLK